MNCPGVRHCLLAALALSVGCTDQTHRAELSVFGTRATITLVGVDADTAAATTGRINKVFNRLHREWHPWEPGGLDDINQKLKAGESVVVSAELAALVRRARQLERESLGTFNPAAGGLVTAWGFHSGSFPVLDREPTDSELKHWINPPVSLASVRIEGDTIRSADPRVNLDLNAIAKGTAVSIALRLARAEGASAAMIDIGGDIGLFGQLEARQWIIGIRNPRDESPVLRLAIDGDDGISVFTSGDYARYRESANGVRLGHVIDPRTGQPVTHTVSLTVVHADAERADAAATALMVANPNERDDIAARMNIDRWLAIDPSGCVEATPAMVQLLLDPVPDC